MSRSGNDYQFFFLAPSCSSALLVQLDHRRIVPADNEKRGRLDARQSRPRKIGAAAARNDQRRRRGDVPRPPPARPRRCWRRNNRSGRFAVSALWLSQSVAPTSRSREQPNVEAELRRPRVDNLLVGCEEID